MSATSIGEIHRVQLEPVKVNQVPVKLVKPTTAAKKHGWLYYILIAVAAYYLLLFIGFIIYSQGFKCNSKHLNGYCSGWSNSCLRGKCAKRCKVDGDCETNSSCVDKHCAPVSAQTCTTITDCGSGEICAGDTTGKVCTPGTNRGPYLTENKTLKLGEYLQSANGIYTAAPDFSGRFHIHGGLLGNTSTPLVNFYWPNDGMRPTSDKWTITLQTDGNFVLSDGTNRLTTRDVAFATTGSAAPGSPGHFVAKLNDNGKFNVYVGTPKKLGDIVPAARPFN